MIKNYLDEIKDYNIRHSLPAPDKTALLVIDMQYYFRELATPILANLCRHLGG